MGFVKKTPLEGTLEDVWLPHIFIKIMIMRLTGILIVETDQSVKKEVYFRKGQVVHITSSQTEDRFGQYLVQLGVLQQEAVDQALAAQKKNTEVKFGDHLVRNQLIEPNRLIELLNEHQEEKLYQLFAHRNGRYTYVKNSQWPEHITVFDLNSSRIFFEAVHKFFSVEDITSYTGLKAECTVFKNTNHRVELPLPPYPSKILYSIQAPIRVHDLVKKLSSSPKKIYPPLFVMIIAGWVDIEFDKSDPDFFAKQDLDPLVEKRASIAAHSFAQKNFFDIFSVPIEFNAQRLQTNYLMLMKKYSEFKGSMSGNQILRTLKVGYQVLSKPPMKKMYIRRLKKFEGQPEKQELDRDFFFAMLLIEAEKFDEAYVILEKLYEKEKTDPDYKAYYLVSLYYNDPENNLEFCLENIEEIKAFMHADSNLAYPHAKMLLDAEKNEEAEKLLFHITQLDPYHAKAQSLLKKTVYERLKTNKANSGEASEAGEGGSEKKDLGQSLKELLKKDLFGGSKDQPEEPSE
jgi:hypothetical protein